MPRSVSLIEFWLDCYVICTRFNGSESSGYRTEKHNTQVGGKPDSLHRFGYAKDIVFDDNSVIDDAISFAHGLGYDCLFHDGHLHVEYDPRWKP